ncbi:glycosyl hydrolase family 18 protein [Kibdelosporangium phytohabitans]|uniref:Glycoside hydrolase family 18 n=2 Tax=Kibdelosporangium phytohabitans TaxID=860235 RepID=A0A0N9IJ31_9PSEU|nr:glycosyl hydrolase family 18 protein [Kibdelosporangium phytohabitans]ALG15088.1 glycoside hydrolase family 18 [Kibdelosporangium phytohabitans]MBE1468544.1 GH18 family chitinase [Kibdelosporangium phytohabitans]
MRFSRLGRRLSAAGVALAATATGVTLALTPAAAATPAATAPAATTPAATDAVQALPPGFRSVGYMPSWSGSVNSIQYSKLTHINYAFVLPNSNGTLQAIPDPNKLRSLVSLGHSNGVKVSLAVGGWNDGNDSAFEALAGNAGSRTTFVDALTNVVDQYSLDGVDIDWEYPDPGQSGNNFTALMQQLGTELHNRGKLLTAAVVSGGGTANGVQPAVFQVVDWLNIMAYDGGSPHANYDWSIQSANGWKSRGLPASKTVLGVPFYSRPAYLTYSQLVAMDPANANRDCVQAQGAQQCYNGIPTIKRKTQWAVANAGGIMNWELSQDTTGSTSLVSAIFDAAGGTTPPPGSGRTGPITGIAGKCVDVAGANPANGTAVQIYSCNGSTAQTWTVGTDGTVRSLGKCMDVASAGTANGTRIQLYDCNGTGAQSWQAQGDGTLRNPASGRCLDATGNSSADGTRLQIWDCFARANQVWRLPA